VQTVDYIDSIKAFFFSDNRQLKSFTEPDPPLMHRQEAFNGGERERVKRINQRLKPENT